MWFVFVFTDRCFCSFLWSQFITGILLRPSVLTNGAYFGMNCIIRLFVFLRLLLFRFQRDVVKENAVLQLAVLDHIGGLVSRV